jgi:hypothetical protein
LTDGCNSAGISEGHGGIKSWILRGTLRHRDELTSALNDWLKNTKFRERMRDPFYLDWKFDKRAMQEVAASFGLSSPLTRKEVAEETAAFLKAYEERRQKIREADRKVLAEFEIELAKNERVKNLLKRIAAKLYSFDGLDLGTDPLPPEYEQRSRKRRTFRQSSEGKIRLLVDKGKSDAEILGEMVMDVIETLKSIGRSEIRPLEEGETRRFFTESEFKKFYLSHEWDEMLDEGESSIMLGMDGLFVVTLRPMPLMTEAEVSALVKSREIEVSNSLGGRCA